MAAPNNHDEPRTATGAFRDPAREALFMDAFAREIRVFYRIALAAIVVMWGSSFWFDLAAPEPKRHQLLLLRFAVVMPVIVIALAVGFLPRPAFRRWWQWASAAVYLAAQFGIAGLVAMAPGQMSIMVVGGYLVTVLMGSSLDLMRAVHIIALAILGAVAMFVAMLSSPSYDQHAIAIQFLWIGTGLVAVALVSIRFEQARRLRFLDRERLERERERTERLLANLLPTSIASRLRDGPAVIADGHEAVSVLFSDLKGFTALSQQIGAEELVERLDRVFSAFDDLTTKHGVEKIKTIGDAYMVVCGAPFARADHAIVATRLGLEMIEVLAELEPNLQLRVGVASGPVVAGVIGRSKYSYDLWGETVNFASRMESHGVPGRVQVSATTKSLLGEAFVLEARGEIQGKGIGLVETFLVVSRAT